MPSVQASLFPFSSSQTVLAHLERLQRRVAKLAPDLPPNACDRLLAELALVATVVDTQEFYIRRDVEQRARRMGLLI